MAVLGPTSNPPAIVSSVPPVVLAWSAKKPMPVLSSVALFTSASVPTAVLLEPVVLSNNAAAPTAVLELPLLRTSAPPPTPVLKLPVVSEKSERQPSAVFPAPVVRRLSASQPSAVG